MKKWISILSVLLIVQILLALWLNLSGKEYGTFQAEEQLLTFDKQAVNRLLIEGEEGKVLLEKKGTEWLLPEHQAIPADQVSVERLLDKLSGLKKGWPVATTSSAAQRFKVDEALYERKLTLSGKDKTLAELYIGSSPGFRKTHIRRPHDEAIFAVEFNSWEAGVKVDDWVDKAVLKLDSDDIVRVEMSGYTLQREGDELQVVGLSDNEETVKEKADSLVDKLATLAIDGLLGTDLKPEYRQDTPVLVIKLQRKKGEALTYTFSKPGNEAYYVLKRSDRKHYFRIAEQSLKPITETTREQLVSTVTEEESAEPTKEAPVPTESEAHDNS